MCGCHRTCGTGEERTDGVRFGERCTFLLNSSGGSMLLHEARVSLFFEKEIKIQMPLKSLFCVCVPVSCDRAAV